MTLPRAPHPGPDLKRWSLAVTSFLERVREASLQAQNVLLIHRDTTLGNSAAGESGRLVFDASVGSPIVSLNGAWGYLFVSGAARNFNQPSGGTLTIASGIITATTMHHRVDTEAAAASDNLDTINGTSGDVVILRTVDSARDVVLTEAGNIVVPGGTTLTLGTTDETVTLYYDGTSWVVLATTGTIA